MATKSKHNQRSLKSRNIEEQRKGRYFGHCMQFQAGVKKQKEKWKVV